MHCTLILACTLVTGCTHLEYYGHSRFVLAESPLPDPEGPCLQSGYVRTGLKQFTLQYYKKGQPLVGTFVDAVASDPEATVLARRSQRTMAAVFWLGMVGGLLAIPAPVELALGPWRNGAPDRALAITAGTQLGVGLAVALGVMFGLGRQAERDARAAVTHYNEWAIQNGCR
jgi:hypothetical protein